MQGPEQIAGLVLVEVLEGFRGRIIARLYLSRGVSSSATAAKFMAHTVLRSSTQGAWKRVLATPGRFQSSIVSLETGQTVSMLCLSGIHIFHLVL